MSLEYCKKTDIGLKRKRNEDFSLTPDDYQETFDTSSLGLVFAVADGMGGHPAGDVASRIACTAFVRTYYQMPVPKRLFYRGLTLFDCRPLVTRIVQTIKKTDREICKYACSHEKCQGLGTTLSVLVLKNNHAIIGHVGDSRIYRMRKGVLELLTQDHTFVQDLVDMGEITREEARENPMRHVLMQALGTGMDEIFTRCERLEPGDIFLLCSDGLHDMVSETDIAAIIQKDMPIGKICEGLVQKALDEGGKDNVTTIVIKYNQKNKDKHG